SAISTTSSNTPHTNSTPTIGFNNFNKGPPPTTVPTACITGSTIPGSINVLRSDTNSIKKHRSGTSNKDMKLKKPLIDLQKSLKLEIVETDQ
ncbi:12218_t:CDS:1, partial [Funneliformis caledonium]